MWWCICSAAAAAAGNAGIDTACWLQQLLQKNHVLLQSAERGAQEKRQKLLSYT
jgi:hypothetical protein